MYPPSSNWAGPTTTNQMVGYVAFFSAIVIGNVLEANNHPPRYFSCRWTRGKLFEYYILEKCFDIQRYKIPPFVMDYFEVQTTFFCKQQIKRQMIRFLKLLGMPFASPHPFPVIQRPTVCISVILLALVFFTSAAMGATPLTLLSLTLTHAWVGANL
jgi:hypothetical protein